MKYWPWHVSDVSVCACKTNPFSFSHIFLDSTLWIIFQSYRSGVFQLRIPPPLRKYFGHLRGVFLSTQNTKSQNFRLRRAIWKKRPRFWPFQGTPFRFAFLLFKLLKIPMCLNNFNQVRLEIYDFDKLVRRRRKFSVSRMSCSVFTVLKHRFPQCFACKIAQNFRPPAESYKGSPLCRLLST